MDNTHAAWAHLVGAGNAILDMAADTTLPSNMRRKLTAIDTKAQSTNFLSKPDMANIGQAMVLLGTGGRGQI